MTIPNRIYVVYVFSSEMHPFVFLIYIALCIFIEYNLVYFKSLKKTQPSHNYGAQFHFIDRQEKLLTFVAEVV